jgi:hypothetical protein
VPAVAGGDDVEQPGPPCRGDPLSDPALFPVEQLGQLAARHRHGPVGPHPVGEHQQQHSHGVVDGR